MVIVILVLLSPVVLCHSLKNEKNPVHRFVFIALIIVADISLISLFLWHIHRFNLTVPSLIKFYIEYIKSVY